jgi:enoyl-CoA hydratase
MGETMQDYGAYQRLKIERDGEVLHITFNRPQRDNLVDGQMHTEMTRIWRDVRADLDAKVVVLRGAGDAWFCNTADPEWAASFDAETYRRVAHEGRWAIHDMVGVQQPIIAALNGNAKNFGCSLMSMCDIVVAADHAEVWDHHNVGFGISSGDGGAFSFPFSMGVNRAKAFMLLGDTLTADDLHRFGVAYKVVPLARLDETVDALAKRLCEQPPEALWWTKIYLNRPIQASVQSSHDLGIASEAYSSLIKPESAKRRS